MDEPSLLDYLEEKLGMRKKGNLPQAPGEQPPVEPGTEKEKHKSRLPWSSLLAILVAIIGQRMLEPATRNVEIAIFLFAVAAGFLVRAILTREWQIAPLKEAEAQSQNYGIRRVPLLFLLPLLLIAFFAFSGNRFTLLNVLLWLVLIATALAAFWIPRHPGGWEHFKTSVRDFLSNPGLRLKLSGWDILLLAVMLIAVFFRMSQLNAIPNEMISDHAEKLLDVNDVLNGQTSIFFTRNTGREAFQFYLTVLVIKLFGTGVSFLSLKIGTALMGLVTLIYVYRLGKELGNRWVGLLAMLLMGMAYWPNVISRIALRFTLYPLFVAPVLFYLLRGLRTLDRNDFILAGAALGIGLQGYSSFRIVPFVVTAGVLIYLLHKRLPGERKNALWGFVLVTLFAVILFLPLGRYWTENPTMFGLRAFSRLGSTERPLPGPAGLIFLSNLWNAAIMPFWSDGNVWAHSVTNRPALDVVTAALYLLGIVALVVRYIQRRTWQDLFLLLSVPLLMMPSILSLAFPEENPALNRTAGAAVPIFIIAAISLEGFLSSLWIKAREGVGRVAVAAVGVLLIFASASQNYDLVFNQYAQSYAQASWNTLQIGSVVKDYIKSGGSVDTAWVVGVPYWVDTRLVGINSGYPTKDYAIWPDQFGLTTAETRSKFFIIKADDIADLDTLKQLYPSGVETLYTNPYPGKDFYAFYVPPVGG